MKIIVLGGSGVTGQLVRHYLADTDWQVDYCSRSESNDPNHRRLDLLGPRSKVMDALGEYDWAVSCIGPFEKWLAKVAGLCVDAGTNYIDINDSIDARQAILSVPAKESRKSKPCCGSDRDSPPELPQCSQCLKLCMVATGS